MSTQEAILAGIAAFGLIGAYLAFKPKGPPPPGGDRLR